MRLLLIAGLLLGTSPLALGQDLRFEAELLPDGSLDVRPSDGVQVDDGAVVSGWTGQPVDDQVYLWTDDSGVLKGIIGSQEEAAFLPLSPGDSLEAYATAGFNPLSYLVPSDQEIQRMMDELGDKLLIAARTRACAFEPLPETISPSVSVSFGIGISGTATLEALWRSSDLCPTARN